MDCKISITTKCNAKCATCPVWEYKGQHMDVDKFKLMWLKLMESKEITKILLNNTGDMYIHPGRKEIFDFIESHHYKPVIMTTNAAAMDYVPKIDAIIISFNGGTKESYEYTTGLDFDKTVKRIKSFYPELSKRYSEIDCLMWDGNEGTEEALIELWKDFPGHIRLSYKYDNQMREDHTLKDHVRSDRIYCDYLDMLSVMPDGKVISCAHDFASTTDFGNIFYDEIPDLLKNPNRLKKQAEHRQGKFLGLCEKCNYNTPIDGKIKFVR